MCQGDPRSGHSILELNPLSLGFEGPGGVMVRLIDRGVRIPTSASRVFSTKSAGDRQIEIHVLKGERKFAMDNHTLGRVVLAGVQPYPSGLPQVEVTFYIDANGLLDLKARDRATGQPLQVTVVASSMLSSGDIARMIRDGLAHPDEFRRD